MSAAIAAAEAAIARVREVPRSRVGKTGRSSRGPRAAIPSQQSLASPSPISRIPPDSVHNGATQPFSTALQENNAEPFASPPVNDPTEAYSPHQSNNSEPFSSPGDNAFAEPFSPRDHTDSSEPFSRQRNNGTLAPFTPRRRNETSEPLSSRRGNTHKRSEEPPRDSQGKIICNFSSCVGLVFERRCEWSKHMDKHERPYKCPAPGCEKLQGFTYSGGLLRHQREVHKMHGGTKEALYCPYANCKRNTGTGFTRKENRDEHVRRVHRRSAADDMDLEPEQQSSKRGRDAVDSADRTDPALLRDDADLPQAEGGAVVLLEDDAGLEEIVGTTPSNPPKRRRLTARRSYANGTAAALPAAEHDADLEIDGSLDLRTEIRRLQESNNMLLRQNQDMRRDYQSVVERLSSLEAGLGRYLLASKH